MRQFEVDRSNKVCCWLGAVFATCVVLGVLSSPVLAQGYSEYSLIADDDYFAPSISLSSFDSPVACDSVVECDGCISCGVGAGCLSCSDCGYCDQCCDCGSHFARWKRRWDGSFDVGLNGAAGSSNDLNMVIGFDAVRKSGLNTTSLDFDYFYQKEDSAVSKNRLYFLARFEHEIEGSNWSWFSDGWFEYDQFEQFRSRIGLHVGAAVLLKETDHSSLKARFGLGVSKKSEGLDTGWKPEILLGLDYQLAITSRQKLKLTSDCYPDLSDFSSYRVNTRASWEVKLDDESDLSLALSAFDRYDSTPDPGEPKNELDYWMSLNWGF